MSLQDLNNIHNERAPLDHRRSSRTVRVRQMSPLDFHVYCAAVRLTRLAATEIPALGNPPQLDVAQNMREIDNGRRRTAELRDTVRGYTSIPLFSASEAHLDTSIGEIAACWNKLPDHVENVIKKRLNDAGCGRVIV